MVRNVLCVPRVRSQHRRAEWPARDFQTREWAKARPVQHGKRTGSKHVVGRTEALFFGHYCFQAGQWRDRSCTPARIKLTEHTMADSWKSNLAAVSPSSSTSAPDLALLSVGPSPQQSSAPISTDNACGDPQAGTSHRPGYSTQTTRRRWRRSSKLLSRSSAGVPGSSPEPVLLNSAFPLHQPRGGIPTAGKERGFHISF